MDRPGLKIAAWVVYCILFLLIFSERVMAWPCNPPEPYEPCGDCQNCTESGCESYCDPYLCMDCNIALKICEWQCGDCGICFEGSCISTCGADQCCDDDLGMCVDKCDPYGGSTCTWTDPPVEDALCAMVSIALLICESPGTSCGWRVVDGPGMNAACASCDPGCSLGSTWCVKLEPILCADKLSLSPPFWIECHCWGTPSVIEYEYAGTRAICP